MRRLFLLALCLGVCLCTLGQTLEQTGSIYYAYPAPADSITPAPDGYKPFYISHYGRHGSRWITNDSRYTSILDTMRSLQARNELTSLGEDVLRRLERVTADAVGRSGHLTPIGERQHRQIAERMVANYPEVFSDSARIKAVSSTNIRCIMSMGAFSDALLRFNPAIDLERSAYDRDMAFIAYTSPEGKAFSADTASWRAEYRQYAERNIQPDRLVASLVKHPDAIDRQQRYDMMMALYWIASDMQDVEIDENFYDLFTLDELQGIWRCINARMYACNGRAPINGGIMSQCAKPLLLNIISQTDEALANGTRQADLRFGHDTHLLRLLALMQVAEASAEEPDMERYHLAWQDFRLSPMAANLQLIFFRNDAGDILVKILLNESETTIPVPTTCAPYYPWPQLRTYLLSTVQ